MTEWNLYPEIIGALSHGPVRLFRQNAGFAWQGTVISHTSTRLVLANPRPIRLGVPGLSDLGGFVGVDITPEDIGTRFAVYCGIEVKGPRTRTTNEQAAFIATVTRLGGRAGVARSVEDARRIIYP